jgi:tetratricopeptide (TPR) repeat protein
LAFPSFKCFRRFNEAETLTALALAGNERLFGFKHPDTLQTLANLAVIYYTQGRYIEAKTLCRRALTGSDRILWTHTSLHPADCGKSRNRLAISGMIKRCRRAVSANRAVTRYLVTAADGFTNMLQVVSNS